MVAIKDNRLFFRRYVTMLVPLIIFVSTSVTLNGCSKHEKQSYTSAKQIVYKFYSHERLIGNHGTLKWSLRGVIGAKGPYASSNSGTLCSNPGQTITFMVRNGGGIVSVDYTPDTEDQSFLGIPVVNADGHNAMIICQTIPETTSNEQQ